ncbi:hypothetical protein NMY22_g11594 [Coprinellus aureogranulatus]|nr:hypothetical protein NMY22_g11594 [Coprinellus aureogranulatus]
MSSQSQLLSMEFDSSKTPAYMDPVEFNYMDSGLDSYLQYPQSPAFTGLGRKSTPVHTFTQHISDIALPRPQFRKPLPLSPSTAP